MLIRNPVISGFYPDPSVCRVGRDYYLVNSTFEYFPGVPIHHSRDLVHWRQIGHCLTRPCQDPLDRVRSSGGIYAPVIRYHDGLFYMVTTVVGGNGNFYVTAKDPAGTWSDPVWIDREGIDPSLLFDDDGKVYFTRQGWGEHGGIFQSELDLKKGVLKDVPVKIWSGTGGPWPEGPHLYKINGMYTLMIAEGGTGYEHMVTMARSRSPWGPFIPNPRNPILTHRDRKRSPIQATGHADLLQAHDGSWWLMFLGIRPQGGRFHHLGRETYLAPVSWDRDGWPLVNQGRAVSLKMAGPRWTPSPWRPEPVRDDFDSRQWAFCWNFLRNPHARDCSLSERPGYLRLHGSAVDLDTDDSPAWVGRRQRHLRCRASACLDFEPRRDGEEAGLCCRMNERFHYDLGVTQVDGARLVFLRRRVKGVTRTVRQVPAPLGPLTFVIRARELAYEFICEPVCGKPIRLGVLPTRELSTERAGGFTGVYFAMYATGHGRRSSVPADFDWFEYQEVP